MCVAISQDGKGFPAIISPGSAVRIYLRVQQDLEKKEPVNFAGMQG